MVSSLKISYTRIQVGLAVGFYKGIPYPFFGEEIFLGDIIISDPVGFYDFGRQ